MSAAGLGAALAAGLAVGRLSAAVAGRYGPPRLRGGRIGRIPATEVVMGIAWLAAVHRFGPGWASVPPLVAATSLVTLSVIDLRVWRLPDAVTLPALAASLASVVAASLALGRGEAIPSAVIAGLGYGAVMWGLHELQPRGLGFGDVKLAPLLGMHVGWVAGVRHPGWWSVLGLAAHALLLSCVIGLLTGLAVALLRRRGLEVLEDPVGRAAPAGGAGLLRTAFPFGPALATGTMLAVLFSQALVG